MDEQKTTHKYGKPITYRGQQDLRLTTKQTDTCT